MNMERATRGLQEAVHRPCPGGKFRGSLDSKPWVLQNPQSVSKERSVLLLMCQALQQGQDVPACSENMCGPWTVFFPQRSPPAEIGTKDTDSQEIIFAGANDLVTAASRPSLHSDSPISTSTPALIVLPGLETRWIFLKPSLSLRSWSQNPRVFFF